MTVTDAPATTTATATALREGVESVLAVLGCFEDEQPEDLRPRAAVEAVIGWLEGSCSEDQVAAAGDGAHAAAREATAPAAVSAARAAAQLAAATRAPGRLPHVRRYADRARAARALAARTR